MSDLPVIQKTYDLIKWYVPILNRLPRHHKFTLGDRAITKRARYQFFKSDSESGFSSSG
jgi:hypothetical protein